MKKVLFTFVFSFFIFGVLSNCFGQEVDNSIIYGPYGEFYINGICSTQDIGGVEAKFEVVGRYKELFLELTNYNNCMVTVLCAISFRVDYGGRDLGGNGGKYEDFNKTLNVVLDAKETKRFSVYCCSSWGYLRDNLKGMIVRKVVE